MHEFIENLKREASANPTLTIAIAAGLLTAAGKFLEASAHHKGSTAYAKYAKIAEDKAKHSVK